jgi:hypothetical protein
MIIVSAKGVGYAPITYWQNTQLVILRLRVWTLPLAPAAFAIKIFMTVIVAVS